MNFWTDHSIMFVLGLVFMPRIMLLWFGLIAPQSIPPILGMMFTPRMFLASTLTAAYGNTNGVLIIFVWILACVFDLIGFISKITMTGIIMQKQAEFFENMQKRQRANIPDFMNFRNPY